jgi:hypothetical protein
MNTSNSNNFKPEGPPKTQKLAFRGKNITKRRNTDPHFIINVLYTYKVRGYKEAEANVAFMRVLCCPATWHSALCVVTAYITETETCL